MAGTLLLSNPYRFSPGVLVTTDLPTDRSAVLPGSSARSSTASGPPSGDRRQVTGRFSYGVLSTIVVRVETFATDRIRASSVSSVAGVATRTLRM